MCSIGKAIENLGIIIIIISQPAVTELSLFDLMLHRSRYMYFEVVLYYKIGYLILKVGQVVDYTSGRSVEDSLAGDALLFHCDNRTVCIGKNGSSLSLIDAHLMGHELFST